MKEKRAKIKYKGKILTKNRRKKGQKGEKNKIQIQGKPEGK